MSDKYVLATDDNGDLAVRTVTAEESPTANSTDIITATTDGKLAVRVVGSGGGGGGDQHNLGWYATESALTTAHATASDGDWAIVGSTDTVWVWDSDTTAWKDTDQKGQVESVNGQTGTVVLTASDVGAATAAQGGKADTAVQPGDLATVATTGAYSDLSGTPTIPTVGDGTITITQGGVTKGTFTTNQSGNTTIDVDAGGGGSSYTAGTGIDITSGVISVTSPTLQNTATDKTTSLTIGGTPAPYANTVNIGVNVNASSRGVIVGQRITGTSNSDVIAFGDSITGNIGSKSVVIGKQISCTNSGCVVIGNDFTSATGIAAIAIGMGQHATAVGAIQIGWTQQVGGATNGDTNTLKISNANGNFEMMSADGTIPAARHATLPAADGTYTLQLVITNGVPTLSWVAV